MDSYQQKLLQNHLAFLASHRGSVQQSGDTTFIESDRPEFTYALLGAGSRVITLSEGVQTIQHFPWSSETPEALKKAGFEPTIGISYMALGENMPEWRTRGDLSIEQAKTQSQLDVFSEVQSRGFNERQESFARWHPWLKAANDRNLQNLNQAFYVGHLGGEAAGTVLTVFAGDTAGIYAVTTLPHHRKKGISATIMAKAIADARARGSKSITLQVKQDSYVEEFYRHLGFQRIFVTGMYRRKN